MQSNLRPLGFVIAFAVAAIIGWVILGGEFTDAPQPATISTDPGQAGQAPN